MLFKYFLDKAQFLKETISRMHVRVQEKQVTFDVKSIYISGPGSMLFIAE